MIVHTITDAKAHLSQYVQEALSGKEVIIGRNGMPAVKLVQFEQPKAKRKAGALKGKLKIHDDFDELPDDIAAALGLHS